MFAFFAIFSFSLKPIILIPGAMRSRLEANSTRHYSWYCPKSLANKLSWLDIFSFVPPYINCYLDYFALDYDPTTKSSVSKENVTINVPGFGSLDNIMGTGPSIFGYRLFKYMDKIIARLQQRGYKEGQNLFGAPYDWRLGVAHLGKYYDNLIKLIEHAYEINQNTKVHLFSHSLGGWVIYVLLTEKTTPEWRQKYIDGVTMSAPSWSGSGTALSGLVRHTLPFVPFYKTEILTDFINSLGMFHIHAPNSFYYENDTLLITKDGKKYKGNEYLQYIREILPEKYRLMAEANFKLTEKPHKPLDVPTNIVYNSGIHLTTGMDMSKGIFGTPIMMEGDGLVGSKGLDWVCNNWNKKDLRCYNFNSSKLIYIHQMLPRSSKSVDVYMSMIFGEPLPDHCRPETKPISSEL